MMVLVVMMTDEVSPGPIKFATYAIFALLMFFAESG